MKKYYFALFIFFVLIYVMPNLMIAISPNEAQEALEAYCTYKYEPFSLANFDSIISGFFISLFGFTKWGIASNSIIALAVLSISTIYAIKKCTNDKTLAICTSLLFFATFWIFLLIPNPSVVGNSGIWGALINFVALGAYFMASREERFSVQRIGMLFLCGVLTFASLIISGLNPFFFSIIVVTIYMLSQKRYVDMLLMPLEIIFIVGALLCLISLSKGESYYAWIISGKSSIISYWAGFFNNITLVKETILHNIKLLCMGILPIIPFVICAIYNDKKNSSEFLKRPIYKFAMIFFITAIAFSVLNRGLILANLPITYLPLSFLIATSLVNYLRTNNRHKLLGSCFLLIGVAAVIGGVNLLLMYKHNLLNGITIILIGLMLVFTVRLSIDKRIATYFLGLALIMLIFTLQISAFATHMWPSARQVKIRVESIIGKNYPANQVEFFACDLKSYQLINFYFNNEIELISDSQAGKIIDHKKVLSLKEFCEIQNKSDKEIIVFANAEFLPLQEQAKTLKFDNLIIYYFK